MIARAWLSLLVFVPLFGCASAPLAHRDVVVAADIDDAHHLELLQRRVLASNARDWDAWQALHTEQCVRTSPDLSAPLVGSAAMRASISKLVESFPDYRVDLLRVVGHGDWAAATLTASGTFGLTGTHFAQTWTAFVRFDGDRIAEFHEHYDTLDLVQQLAGLSSPKPF
ncbi:MAG TPA: nuclear transport factor 2 family protein [Myxococcota bacterium]|jgi:ketosteroid isomerase-like protein